MNLQRPLFLLLIMVSTSTNAFPEIPFCPLGGPPGWFNRMTDNHHDYRYPPRFYPIPYQPVHPGHPGYQQPYTMPVNETPGSGVSGQ